MEEQNFETAKNFLKENREGSVVTSMKNFCTEDFVWWVSGYGEVQDSISETSKAIKGHATGEGTTFKIRGVTREGDRVALETESSTPLKNGTVYNNQYHFLFIFKDGRIAELREYHNTAHAREIWAPLFNVS